MAMWEIEFLDAFGQRLNLLGPLRDLRPGQQESTNYYVNETLGDWQEIHYPVIVPQEAQTARLAARIGDYPGRRASTRRGWRPWTCRHGRR